MHSNNSFEVAIIDYGLGNLFSVKQACDHVGLRTRVTSQKKDITKADAMILPGVGAFGDAMGILNKMDLVRPILDFINSKRPFLGICLGMQLLFSESEEFGQHKGLDVIKGKVVKFPKKNNDGQINKIPQVGWNRIKRPLLAEDPYWNGTVLNHVNDGEFMYFVHSFYAVPEEKSVALSITEYGEITYCSSIQRGNIFAFQFHPEKSAYQGLKIYRNFSDIIRRHKGA